MNNVKTFESYTKPVIQLDNQHDIYPGGCYLIDASLLEGKMYSFFKEGNEVEIGNNDHELRITYEFEAFGGNNPEDIQNAMEYLDSLQGVESVIHKMGFAFDVTFDKPIELK